MKSSPPKPVKKIEIKKEMERPAQEKVVKKEVKNWLEQSFGDIVVKSQPKAYLFKLVEYNKIEIVENH